MFSLFDEKRNKGGVSPGDEMQALSRRLTKFPARIIDSKLRLACWMLNPDLDLCLQLPAWENGEPARWAVAQQAFIAGRGAERVKSMLDRMATLERRAL